MPNKPSWLLRVDDILADLARPELASLPFPLRAAIETLFGLHRRPVLQIMLVGARRLATYSSLGGSASSPRWKASWGWQRTPLARRQAPLGGGHRGVHAGRPWH